MVRSQVQSEQKQRMQQAGLAKRQLKEVGKQIIEKANENYKAMLLRKKVPRGIPLCRETKHFNSIGNGFAQSFPRLLFACLLHFLISIILNATSLRMSKW